MHLEFLAPIPLSAITRIDRRPSLHPIPFQDTVFVELDISLIAEHREDAERLLDEVLDKARTLGEADWIGRW